MTEDRNIAILLYLCQFQLIFSCFQLPNKYINILHIILFFIQFSWIILGYHNLSYRFDHEHV